MHLESEASLRIWVSDKLMSLMGYSETFLTRFIIRLAKILKISRTGSSNMGCLALWPFTISPERYSTKCLREVVVACRTRSRSRKERPHCLRRSSSSARWSWMILLRNWTPERASQRWRCARRRMMSILRAWGGPLGMHIWRRGVTGSSCSCGMRYWMMSSCLMRGWGPRRKSVELLAHVGRYLWFACFCRK